MKRETYSGIATPEDFVDQSYLGSENVVTGSLHDLRTYCVKSEVSAVDVAKATRKTKKKLQQIEHLVEKQKVG